jgi:hypothetical protein
MHSPRLYKNEINTMNVSLYVTRDHTWKGSQMGDNGETHTSLARLILPKSCRYAAVSTSNHSSSP